MALFRRTRKSRDRTPADPAVAHAAVDRELRLSLDRLESLRAELRDAIGATASPTEEQRRRLAHVESEYARLRARIEESAARARAHIDEAGRDR
ncbi:hypothetical protein LX16_3950 [Stackebrandtia albiflava]|uniref:Uncharacterized protein n=1 Tax=Stackebrandtia albiflava TaxID=406432 RepID=A0A562UY43_9ACTN|nr:hypothetical protein [Stackebrandtia albiflava]TWJ10532.1 hypothetical protein LX16_3950 [Stackebrandtia albiflava]